MQPLNRQERNNAFLSFLLLFLITVTVIIAVTFFSIEVPCRESEQLRRKISDFQTEKEVSDSFNLAMKEAIHELAKFDGKDGNVVPDAINSRVQGSIRKMNRWMENIPDANNSIYALIVQNIADLTEVKTKLKRMEDAKN